MSKVYRPRPIFSIVFLAIILAVVLLIALTFSRTEMWLFRLLLLALAAIVVIGALDRLLLPLWRSWIMIDDHAFLHSNGRYIFEAPWKDVVAVWTMDDVQGGKWLYIGTQEGTLSMRLLLYTQNIPTKTPTSEFAIWSQPLFTSVKVSSS